jgi:hypothetical protein
LLGAQPAILILLTPQPSKVVVVLPAVQVALTLVTAVEMVEMDIPLGKGAVVAVEQEAIQVMAETAVHHPQTVLLMTEVLALVDQVAVVVVAEEAEILMQIEDQQAEAVVLAS